MSFCMLSPGFFGHQSDNPTIATQRDTRLRPPGGCDFFVARRDSVEKMFEAAHRRASHDEFFRLSQDFMQEAKPGVAWIMCSRNLRHAIQKLATWDTRLDERSFTSLQNGRFRVDIETLIGGGRAVEFGLINLSCLYRDIVDDPQLLSLHVTSELKALGKFIEDHLQLNVFYGAEGVFFDVQLSHPDEIVLQTYNAQLEPFLPRTPEVFDLTSIDDLVSEAINVTRASISEPSFSCGDLAKAMGLSKRTLQRRFSSEGTSFSKLCDQVRAECLETGLALGEKNENLVDQLGYKDARSIYKLKRRVH